MCWYTLFYCCCMPSGLNQSINQSLNQSYVWYHILLGLTFIEFKSAKGIMLCTPIVFMEPIGSPVSYPDPKRQILWTSHAPNHLWLFCLELVFCFCFFSFCFVLHYISRNCLSFVSSFSPPPLEESCLEILYLRLFSFVRTIIDTIKLLAIETSIHICFFVFSVLCICSGVLISMWALIKRSWRLYHWGWWYRWWWWWWYVCINLPLIFMLLLHLFSRRIYIYSSFSPLIFPVPILSYPLVHPQPQPIVFPESVFSQYSALTLITTTTTTEATFGLGEQKIPLSTGQENDRCDIRVNNPKILSSPFLSLDSWSIGYYFFGYLSCLLYHPQIHSLVDSIVGFFHISPSSSF